jgi:HSP20 family protein
MANLVRRRNEPQQRELASRGVFGGWEPLNLMNELFRATPLGALATAPFLGEAFMPRFDVRETKDGYIFTADLPGVKENDLEISLSGNTLTVSGQRMEEETQEGDQYHCTERSYGEFRRSFTLPESADAERAGADFRDGLLRVTVPKRPESQPRKIQVGSAKPSGAKA